MANRVRRRGSSDTGRLITVLLREHRRRQLAGAVAAALTELARVIRFSTAGERPPQSLQINQPLGYSATPKPQAILKSQALTSQN